MLSVGRCGVARLQMKFGHMDGMHCIIDVISILVKIKSVALYNCRTVYFWRKWRLWWRMHIDRTATNAHVLATCCRRGSSNTTLYHNGNTFRQIDL